VILFSYILIFLISIDEVKINNITEEGNIIEENKRRWKKKQLFNK